MSPWQTRMQLQSAMLFARLQRPSRTHYSRFHSAIAATSRVGELTSAQQVQIGVFIDTLLEANTKFNLTAVASRDEAYTRHVEDSLAMLPWLDACALEQGIENVKLVDVGSGGGLPGMIIAIARPAWDIVLLDSLKKRCDFTSRAAAAADLSNVSVEWARAEDAGRDERLRERFDIAVARAVAELRVLAELCLPLVRCGGHWVAAKGAHPEREVIQADDAFITLGGRLHGVEQTESEAPDGRRTVVIVNKVATTNEKYPRRAGTPEKRPL